MVSNLKELIDEPELAGIDAPEERFTTSSVSWQIYEALLAKLENNSHYRIFPIAKAEAGLYNSRQGTRV
jgi:hypothetical protein